MDIMKVQLESNRHIRVIKEIFTLHDKFGFVDNQELDAMVARVYCILDNVVEKHLRSLATTPLDINGILPSINAVLVDYVDYIYFKL